MARFGGAVSVIGLSLVKLYVVTTGVGGWCVGWCVSCGLVGGRGDLGVLCKDAVSIWLGGIPLGLFVQPWEAADSDPPVNRP